MDIKAIVSKVKGEVSLANESDGLCYYACNNVLYDLEDASIMADMFNIRDVIDMPYDHYFVLANESDKKYLIDLTYEQFVKKDGELRFFNEWPSEVLKKSEEGKNLLNNLLNDGYSLVGDSEFITYLKGFNSEFEPFFTLDDMISSKIR